MVQQKKFDAILRLGSGGLSSSRFDDDVPEVNCTWTASFSWRVKEAVLWFESYGSKNLTGGTTWSSQSTSTDWLTRTHHWSSPRSKLANKKPKSTRKLRKFPVTSGQGSKHGDWTASRWWARWRSQSSSCQHHVIIWHGLIPADHEYLDSVAWPCHDCEVAPVWHHDVTNARTCQFSAVCLTVFLFEFRPRTFTIGFYGKNSIISELMIFGVQFSFKVARNEVENASFAQRSAHRDSRIWRPGLIEPAAERKRRARGRRLTFKSAYPDP